MVILIISLVLLQFSKAGYYGFSIIFLLLLLKHCRVFISNNLWFRVFLVFSGAIALVVFFNLFLLKFRSYYQSFAVGSDIQLYLEMLYNTIKYKRSFYIETLLGYFGWLDFQYDVFNYFMVGGLLVLFALRSIVDSRKRLLTNFELGIFWLFPIFNVFLLITLFYFSWTSPGSFVSEGVQGRYFLPLVPFVMLGIIETILFVGKRRSMYLLTIGLLIIVLWSTTDAVYKRYYDFSNNFFNSNSMLTSYRDGVGRDASLYTKVNSKNMVESIVHANKGDVVGGFEFLRYPKAEDYKIKVPYKYELRDEKCDRVRVKGFLDVSLIDKNENVKQPFLRSFVSSGESLCLRIYPILTPGNEAYFEYVGDAFEKPLVQLMFVNREQNYP